MMKLGRYILWMATMAILSHPVASGPGIPGDSRGSTEEPEIVAADIIFVIDESGSMGSFQQAVRDNALFIFDGLDQATNGQFRVGLVGYGRSGRGTPRVITGLTRTLSEFTSGTNQLEVSGSYEPAFTAVQWVADGTLNLAGSASGVFTSAGICTILITDEPSNDDYYYSGCPNAHSARDALQQVNGVFFGITDISCSYYAGHVAGDNCYTSFPQQDFCWLADETNGTTADLYTLGIASQQQALLDTVLNTCVQQIDSGSGGILLQNRTSSAAPSSTPSAAPSPIASTRPSSQPSFSPSDQPSARPSMAPSHSPSLAPSDVPSITPSLAPTRDPDCEDKLDQTFFVEYLNQDKDCIWLSGRDDDVERLCVQGHRAYDLCEDTCGACIDPCQDADDSITLPNYNGRPNWAQTCSALADRPRDWGTACGNPRIATLCQDVCNSCVYPSDAPSVAPSDAPSGSPSILQIIIPPCDDNDAETFDVFGTDRTCAWLNPRLDRLVLNEGEYATVLDSATYQGRTWRNVLCVESHPAFHACEETCGVCQDNCFDDDSRDATFLDVNGVKRNCEWLRSTNVVRNRDLYCGVGQGIAPYLCGETCNTCDMRRQ